MAVFAEVHANILILQRKTEILTYPYYILDDWDASHNLFQEFEFQRRAQCLVHHWILGLENTYSVMVSPKIV